MSTKKPEIVRAFNCPTLECGELHKVSPPDDDYDKLSLDKSVAESRARDGVLTEYHDCENCCHTYNLYWYR